MNDDLSYTDSNGNMIFTSKYYRNRGSCCKSACLHCPYGYTLREVGVKVQSVSDSLEKLAESFFDDHIAGSGVSNQLLASAFKTQQKKWNPAHYKVLSLKGFFCGLVEIVDGEYKKHHLLPEFCDQGIDDAYIRSIL